MIRRSGSTRPSQDVTYWLRFHTRAPVVTDPQRAAFAILSRPEQAPPFDAFAPVSYTHLTLPTILRV